MKKSYLLVTLLAVISFSVNAQKPAKKGDYSFLKGQTKLNIQFDYSDMKVGRDLDEEDYVKEKVEKHNEDEAGKGDKWKEGWYGARESRYHPKFKKLINKYLGEVGMTAAEEAKAKYTLIVHTVYTEPGFNAGVVKKPAACNFVLKFIETDGGKEVAEYLMNKVPGSQVAGYDFDAGSRLAECYAKCGKSMGKYIVKALK